LTTSKFAGFQLALHQVLAVKESQGVQGGKEHFPHFVGTKGPGGEDLREVCSAYSITTKRNW